MLYVENMLEVLGAGPGRTGTESLQEALHILDKGPCYHMSEVFKGGRPRIDLWLECERNVTKGTEFDFERIYAEDGKTAFKSAVDYPSVTFFPEIFIQYPNVKVVLSVRDSAEVRFHLQFEHVPGSRCCDVANSLQMGESKHKFTAL